MDLIWVWVHTQACSRSMRCQGWKGFHARRCQEHRYPHVPSLPPSVCYLMKVECTQLGLGVVIAGDDGFNHGGFGLCLGQVLNPRVFSLLSLQSCHLQLSLSGTTEGRRSTALWLVQAWCHPCGWCHRGGVRIPIVTPLCMCEPCGTL